MDCKDEKCPHNEDVVCKNTENSLSKQELGTDQEPHYQSDEYQVILSLLNRCGRLAKAEPTRGTKSELEHTHQVYRQNTEKLLRCYRRYVWELNSSCNDCAAELALPLEKVTEYLKNMDVGDDTTARRVAYRNKSLSISKEMIDYLNICLTRLKSMPAIKSRGTRKSLSGEALYRVLQITYLFPPETVQENNGIPQKKKNDPFYSPQDYSREDIIQMYGGSRRAYYAHRKTAIEELSLIMWGGTSEFITTLSELLSKLDI